VRIGEGETVHRDRARTLAQRHFVAALNLYAWDAVKEVLATEPTAHGPIDLDAVASWQRRYHLDVPWITNVVVHTWFISRIEGYADEFPNGCPLLVPPGRVDPDRPPVNWEASRFARELEELSVFARDLSAADDGYIATFDLRKETVNAAMDRILPIIEARLRTVLVGRAESDIHENQAVEPRLFRSSAPFAWLVWFQVLEKSKNEIAEAVGVNRSQVIKATNFLSELIGLPQRTIKRGRPITRAKHSRTIKVVR
jgi:hypothetical protein